MASPFLPIFEDFFRLTESTPLAEHHLAFRQAVNQRLAARPHGRADDWDQIIADLTPPKDSIALLNEPAVRLTAPGPVDTDKLRSTLAKLHPWRKGPFNIFDVFIDSEWRSDWKWSRLIDRIEPLRDRNVLDIGCGTGALAIAARKLGAAKVVAFDLDEWSYENTLANCERNEMTGEVRVLHGTISSLQHQLEAYDVVLANINLNVLAAEMTEYARHLVEGGSIAFSGFYTADVPALRVAAEAAGLKWQSQTSREDWACALFVKTGSAA